jgi:hypothetical protein
MLSNYITVHSIAALKSKEFSIICGNIVNTNDKLHEVKRLFPEDKFHIELHDIKYNMNVICGMV